MHNFFQFAADNWLWLFLFLILLIAYFVVDGRLRSSNGREVSPSDAVFLANRQKAKMIDIRPEEAFKAGHIADIKQFDAAAFEASLKRLKKPKDAPIIVVCQKGISAKPVAQKLIKEGLDARVLAGGMDAWKKAGMPIVTN